MALVVLQSPGRVFNLETQSVKTRIFIRLWSDLELPLFLLMFDVTLVFDDSELNHIALVVLKSPLGIFQPENPKYFLENVQKVLLTCLVRG